MKYKQATGAALALALSVSVCAPAQAAFGAPQAGFWMSAASAVRQVRNAAEEQGTPGLRAARLRLTMSNAWCGKTMHPFSRLTRRSKA